MHELYVSSPAPTGAPGRFNITSVESRSLSVVWGTVPCPHRGGPITGYRLHYSNGSDSYTVNITGERSTQYNLQTGLTPFTNYTVQVAAVSDRGTGPYSTPLTVETLQDGKVFLKLTFLLHYVYFYYMHNNVHMSSSWSSI